ncbi:hypothetical protein APA66_33925 [Pseudomonas aeruginosa]|uniref:D-glucuronyl C5-epimerase C-terminal domain-containing protein n=3 Tax=Gammaproteobacteria TaxID=1236 RepID=A0A643EL35_PSEAI|nr:hypothetical protein HMPREF1224_06062 [Pseudomonas sp. P179]KAB0560908.1 hypothetical protein F7R07_12260 [Pseudomonas aeruginosa]OPE13717.1 hypothetical protein APA66_33925 [Pseudomonas aeruginosa]TEQ17427.1 hypothetical protein IPC61_14130 [Pseudomonas aeruginosa]
MDECKPMKRSASLIAFLLLSASLHAAEHPQKSLAARSAVELAPFQWSWMDPVSYDEAGLQKTAAKKDPLRPFFLAFRLLVEHEKTGEEKSLTSAKRVLDFMLDEYQPATREADGTRWFYGFDYDRGIKAPWWSGMDGFFGPMTLFAGWQATGEERYREAALKSAKLMIRQPTEGGSLWRDGDSCWISEYSWNGITRDKEYHVLNGHLWGLQALYMLAEASGDKALNEAYQCARKGTLDRLPEFYNSTGSWTWYQLVPKVINPTHYNILETAQFRALHAITRDNAYKDPEQRRIAAFQKAYPLYLIETKKGLEIQFSMMGAPNAYWTDTYPVTVSCTVGNKTVSQTNKDAYSTKPIHERMILRLPVNKVPKKCSVSVKSSMDIAMYTQSKFKTIKSPVEDFVKFTPLPSMQASSLQEGIIHITTEKGDTAKPGEGRVMFDVNRDLSESEMIGMVIHTTEDSQLGIVLDGANEKRASSYYPVIKSGKDNIVIFNKLGFDKGSELEGHIAKIMLRFYTKPNERDRDIEIKEVSVIRNTANLEDFLRRNQSANFHQQ